MTRNRCTRQVFYERGESQPEGCIWRGRIQICLQTHIAKLHINEVVFVATELSQVGNLNYMEVLSMTKLPQSPGLVGDCFDVLPREMK